jgi:hypothetical protein
MSANWSLPSRHGSTAAAALLQPDMPSPWPLATVSRLVIGLLIAMIIVVGLTNPGGAQSPATTDDATASHNRHLYAQCMRDWDRATHMTKQEWSGACQRVLREHEDPAQASQQFISSNQRRVR